MPLVELIAQSSRLAKRSLSSARAMNYMTQVYDMKGTKSATAIVTTPGAEIAVTGTSSDSIRGRGLFLSSSGPEPSFQSRLYGVWNQSVYRYNLNRTKKYKIGTIADTGTPVSMCDNGTFFVICDGTNIYTSRLDAVDGSATLTTVTLPFKPGSSTERIQPTHVGFIAERIVVNSLNSNVWFYSNLSNNTSITFGDADFYSAGSSADPILSLKVINGNIWTWGYRSFNIWSTSAGSNPDDPFDYVNGSSSDIGIKAPYSVATANNLSFWLASSDVGSDGIYIGKSSTVHRISTDSIEEQLAGITQRDKAIGYAYTYRGSTFYVLTFDADNRTFVYDTSTNLWHERGKRDIPNGVWANWPYTYVKMVADVVYAQLLTGGDHLIKLSEDIYTEWDDAPIVREYDTIPYWDNLTKLQLRGLTLDMEVGATNYTSPSVYGYDPQIGIQVSLDGYEFGKVRQKSIGKQGQYKKAVRWKLKGLGKTVVFKITCSAPVPHAIYQGRFDYASCSRT